MSLFHRMTMLPPLFASLRITAPYLSPSAEITQYAEHQLLVIPKEKKFYTTFNTHAIDIVIYLLVFHLIIIQTQMHKEVVKCILRKKQHCH